MFKVAKCEFCGQYFRTGKVRLVIVKNAEKEETKSIICKTCYAQLNQGEGVEKRLEDVRGAAFG